MPEELTVAAASDWNQAVYEVSVEHERQDPATLRIGRPSSQLLQQTPARSEEAFYPLHRANEGNAVIDASGAGNDAVVSGGASTTLLGERFAGVVDITGDDGSLSLPAAVLNRDSIPLDDPPQFVAFEIWIRPRDGIRAQTAFAIDELLTLDWNDQGDQALSISLAGDSVAARGASERGGTGAWQHANGYWHVGEEIGLSVNGGPWNSAATTANPYVDPVSQSTDSERWFDGQLTELRCIYDARIARQDSLFLTTGTHVTPAIDTTGSATVGEQVVSSPYVVAEQESATGKLTVRSGVRTTSSPFAVSEQETIDTKLTIE